MGYLDNREWVSVASYRFFTEFSATTTTFTDTHFEFVDTKEGKIFPSTVIRVKNDSSVDIEISFDGTNVHDKILGGEVIEYRFRRERQIYIRHIGGVSATGRIQAWWYTLSIRTYNFFLESSIVGTDPATDIKLFDGTTTFIISVKAKTGDFIDTVSNELFPTQGIILVNDSSKPLYVGFKKDAAGKITQAARVLANDLVTFDNRRENIYLIGVLPADVGAGRAFRLIAW